MVACRPIFFMNLALYSDLELYFDKLYVNITKAFDDDNYILNRL